MNEAFQKIVIDIRNGEVNGAADAIARLTSCSADAARAQVRSIRQMFDPDRFVVVRAKGETTVGKASVCETCGGMGWVLDGADHKTCTECDGSGKFYAPATLDELKAALDADTKGGAE